LFNVSNLILLDTSNFNKREREIFIRLDILNVKIKVIELSYALILDFFIYAYVLVISERQINNVI